MELAQGAQLAHFDIHGGYYEDPEIMEGVKRLIALRNRALAWDDRASQAEILVVMDEDSQHYLTFRNPLSTVPLSAQLAVMGFVAPYDAMLLSDLDKADLRRYKLAVVLNAIKLDSEDRASVRRALASGGRTVIWLHAPGYLTSQGKAAGNMQATTDVRIEPDPTSPSHGAARWADRGDGVSVEVPIIPGEQFCVADPEAQTLAVRADRPQRAVAARKRLADWISIYSAAAPLPATVLRHIAAEAGVHLYTNRPDCLIFAKRHGIMLGASESGGPCEVTLLDKRTVVDFSDGTQIASGNSQFTVNLRPKEVRIFLAE